MALSKAAQKLLLWLGMYKISASEYSTRIDGVYPNDFFYNVNWIVGHIDREGVYGRQLAAPRRGLFKSALSELVTGGY